MVSMHPMFGKAYGNEHDTCCMYQEHTPNCQIPDQKLLLQLKDGLGKTVHLICGNMTMGNYKQC